MWPFRRQPVPPARDTLPRHDEGIAGDPRPSSVPGVNAARLARYEQLRNGPDAARVAEALARDWAAVGGYLRTAMDRVRWPVVDELNVPDEVPVLARVTRRPRRYDREGGSGTGP